MRGKRVHLYPAKKRLSFAGLLITGLVFLAAVAIFWIGFRNALNQTAAEQLAQMKEAIDRAVVTCYAIEGSYPPSLTYLEEHYGVVIDHDRYVVDYTTIGSNVRPAVQVVSVGAGG